ncbi:hypothetical protein MC885_012211, partial [Smutsia gigantea]
WLDPGLRTALRCGVSRPGGRRAFRALGLAGGGAWSPELWALAAADVRPNPAPCRLGLRRPGRTRRCLTAPRERRTTKQKPLRPAEPAASRLGAFAAGTCGDAKGRRRAVRPGPPRLCGAERRWDDDGPARRPPARRAAARRGAQSPGVLTGPSASAGDPRRRLLRAARAPRCPRAPATLLPEAAAGWGQGPAWMAATSRRRLICCRSAGAWATAAPPPQPRASPRPGPPRSPRRTSSPESTSRRRCPWLRTQPRSAGLGCSNPACPSLPLLPH